MKKSVLALFLSVVMTATSFTVPVLASPVEVTTSLDGAEAEVNEDAAFTVVIGDDVKSYTDASKFIEIMDTTLQGVESDTDVQVNLSTDIEVEGYPLVIWGGKVTLELGNHTLTSGGSYVYDQSRSDALTDYSSWEAQMGTYCSAGSAIIVAPGASLTIKGLSGTVQAYAPYNTCTSGISVANTGSLTVDSGVLVKASEHGIQVVEGNATVKGKIDVDAPYSGGVGIAVYSGSLNVEGAEIDVESTYTKSTTSYGIDLNALPEKPGSDFSMKGGTISVLGKSSVYGIANPFGTGKFMMSGVKSASTNKDDIKIKAISKDAASGLGLKVYGVYVDDYKEESDAYIKNTTVVASADKSDDMSGIQFDNLSTKLLTIENCDVDAKSIWEPGEEETSPYSVCGIMSTDGVESNSVSKIKNVIVNCEGPGKIEGIRSHDIDGARITVANKGFLGGGVYGIYIAGEKVSSVKNAVVSVTGKKAARSLGDAYIYGLSNASYSDNLYKTTVGKNCVFEVIPENGAYGRALDPFYDEEDLRFIAEDGKWFDKSGKSLSREDLNTAKYVKTSVGKTNTPDPEKKEQISLSKLTFAWSSENEGTEKSPYMTYNSAERKLGFALKTADGATLSEDTDYTVTYTPNKSSNHELVHAGKVTVTIEAVKNASGQYEGDYKGKITKKYTIKPASLDKIKNSGDLTVEVNNGNPVVYSPTGAQPEFEVRYKGIDLVNKTDYTYKITNNKIAAAKSAAKAPVLKFSGKGDYTGKLEVTFDIVAKPLDRELETFSFKGILYSEKESKYKAKPTIVDGKKKLKLGKDYTIDGYYTNPGCTSALNGVPQVQDRVYVKITAVANGNYCGEEVVSYAINEALLNKAIITLKEGVTLPAEASDVTASMLSVKLTSKSTDYLIPEADYEIVDAEYKTSKGKTYLVAKIVGGSNDKYGGEKKVKVLK